MNIYCVFGGLFHNKKHPAFHVTENSDLSLFHLECRMNYFLFL